jgi:RNA polymerase sigma factor (sigma-70 family)
VGANDRAKAMLREYRDLRFEEERIRREIKLLDAMAQSPGTVRPRLVNPQRPAPRERLSGIVTDKIHMENALERVAENIADRRSAIETLLSCLPSRERQIVRMRYFELMAWYTIASEMSCSVRTVHNYHREALERLSERLTDVT